MSTPAPATSTHRCPAARCPREIDDQFLMCPMHWRMCPRAIQRAVNLAYYDPAQGVGSAALRAAQLAAIRAVNTRLETSE